MSDEYISKADAITAACKGFCHPGVRCPETPCREQTKYLRDLPSADVVQVVRCKDCEHYYFADNRIPQEQRYVCEISGEIWKPDSFCSYGERKE